MANNRLVACGAFRDGVAASGPSCADVMAFEALPEDVQALPRRVLGAGTLGLVNGGVSEALLREAYECGFEDCADQIDRPYMSDWDADEAVREILGLPRKERKLTVVPKGP